jgi:hypothetical protein
MTIDQGVTHADHTRRKQNDAGMTPAVVEKEKSQAVV